MNLLCASQKYWMSRADTHWAVSWACCSAQLVVTSTRRTIIVLDWWAWQEESVERLLNCLLARWLKLGTSSTGPRWPASHTQYALMTGFRSLSRFSNINMRIGQLRAFRSQRIHRARTHLELDEKLSWTNSATSHCTSFGNISAAQGLLMAWNQWCPLQRKQVDSN